MFPEEVTLTTANREDVFDIEAEYPFCLREVITREGKNTVVTWHWHEELEFVYVLEGEVEYRASGKSILLKEKESLFVNRNVMHQVVVPKPAHQARYLVFMFRKDFLAEEGSRLERAYVQPVLYKEKLQIVVMRNENNSRSIPEQLNKIAKLCQTRPFGYDMKVRNCLAELWLDFFCLLGVTADTEVLRSTEKEERLKKMLNRIQQDYGKTFSLRSIAEAAQVSERECLRCFREELNTTPFTYLNEYRLQMACVFLDNTSDTILSISEKCGFSSAGYFGKVFRREIGCTPREYREREKQD